VDNYLIEKLTNAHLELHHPQPREIAVSHDQPWEGNCTCYHTVFKDGDRYRMYYNGGHFSFYGWAKARAQHEEFTCYAESRDGIHWTKPKLGLVEYQGSKENNIILAGKWTHCFAPFKDSNPKCKPGEKYKAVAFCHGIRGLHAFRSADGLHWSLLSDEPIITEGAFDSQNLALWDSTRQRYVAFHRYIKDGKRDIMTATSEDFLDWSKPVGLAYGDAPREHLYTNAITAYSRAPHIFMGFPMRFVDRRHVGNRIPGVSDGLFMSSRDGRTFRRWSQAFIRPGLNRLRWFNRCNMTAWGILETEADLPGRPKELSILSSEGYAEGREVRVRRFTLRLDGFVSVSAPPTGGEVVTRPLTFSLPNRDELRPRPSEPLGRIVRERKSPIFGKASLRLTEPTILELPGTQNLGKHVTLALVVRGLPKRRTRLFSADDGFPFTYKRRTFFFDIRQPKQRDKSYLQFWCVGGPRTLAPSEPLLECLASGDTHHFAATWDEGLVTLYVDGKKMVSDGRKINLPMVFDLGDLRLGEDYPPAHTLDNPLIGTVDDVLVLRRVLSGDEIARLAKAGAESVVDHATDKGVLYTMEGNDPHHLTDQLRKDGAQNSRFPQPERLWGDAMLLLNVATSAAGNVRCEIQDERGQPLPGFTLSDCDEIVGDEIERPVSWNGKAELRHLAGRPIRLRLQLEDADLYAIRFGQPETSAGGLLRD